MVGYVYILSNPSFEGMKIGMTKHLNQRIRALQTGTETPFHKRAIFKLEKYKQMEKWLHYQYHPKHISREFYALTEDDLDDIVSEYCEYLECYNPPLDQISQEGVDERSLLCDSLVGLFNYPGDVVPHDWLCGELCDNGYSEDDILEVLADLESENKIIRVAQTGEWMII